jgi:excisionase family DNA binding protein
MTVIVERCYDWKEERNMLWTVKQVADYLNVSISLIYKLVNANELSCVRLGDCIRFMPEAVENMISNKTNKPQAISVGYGLNTDMNFNSQYMT